MDAPFQKRHLSAKVETSLDHIPKGAPEMKITTFGIDLAKNVIQVHGIDVHGNTVLRKQLRRNQVIEFFTKLQPCLVGMEACGSAHHWARKLEQLGYTVKLMAPQFVKPYVKTNKNDVADAEAICEAVGRKNMRFVPVKNIEQQAILSVHRARQSFVKARTAQANQIRGLLAEYGIVVPQGISCIVKDVLKTMEAGGYDLPGNFQQLIARLVDHFKELDKQVDELERQIKQWHRDNEASCKLAEIPGIGPITASALVASVGDAKAFKNGRQMAAWLGLVPRQHSTGGKPMLLGISKRGDTYLRTLLIHGARSIVRLAQAKTALGCGWLQGLMSRRNANVATVALANKNARIVWALLTKDDKFRSGYFPARAGN